LRRGDLGAVVDVHPPDGLEVEFVLASGRTRRSSLFMTATSGLLAMATSSRFAR
jgi:hypothetical protein